MNHFTLFLPENIASIRQHLLGYEEIYTIELYVVHVEDNSIQNHLIEGLTIYTKNFL